MIAGSGTESCFTIDLSGVTFMGSSGLRMLLAIKKALLKPSCQGSTGPSGPQQG
jgi:anti-anti-sigma regulatory factor